jgi:RNA polymerase sigma-70 factor (ECF subfamily)
MVADVAAERLIRQAAGGDRDAFTAVVRQYQSMVFGLAWNFLRDEATAEELAQDVFLELYRALPNLMSGAHVANWLRRVTTHRCIDYSRYRRARPQIALEEIAEPAAASVAWNEDLFLMERLRRLTATLPEKARAVIILRYQEDLEPTQIAETLGIPLNTVKSHLQRSIAMLREKLGRTGVNR